MSFALNNTPPLLYSTSSTTHVYQVVCQTGSFQKLVTCLVLMGRHKLFCKWFLWFELKASSLFCLQPVCRLAIMWHLWCSQRPNSSFPEMHTICFCTLSTATDADVCNEYSYIPLSGGVCSQTKQRPINCNADRKRGDPSRLHFTN